MSSYSKSIKNILAQELSGEVSTYSTSTITQLTTKINNYLVRLEQWNKRTTAYYKAVAQSDPDMREELKRYIATKQMIKIMPEIEHLLKEGYQMIDIIREKVTGESIQYFVGVEYRGKLYEGYLTMEQILSMAKATPQWKGSLDSMIKLRLSGTNKGTLADFLKEAGSFRNDGINASNLYSAVRAYASASGKKNEGNIYEAYRVLRSRYSSDTIPPAIWNPDEFDTIYLATRKNTGSFVTGGDILNDQIKFFGGSVPSLASISTIQNTLTSFVQSISTLAGNDLQNALNRLFNSQGDDNVIDSVVEEKIDSTTDKLITLATNGKT